MTQSREFVDAELAERGLAAADDVAEAGAGLRRTILESVGRKKPFAGFLERLGTMLDLPADTIEPLLAQLESSDASPWEDGSAAGVRLLHFDGGPRVADAHCGLVRVPAGTRYPSHRHIGDEWAFILQGSSREEDGRVLAPGDLVRYAEGSSHSFTALGPEAFIFVVVLHGGVEFAEPHDSTDTSR